MKPDVYTKILLTVIAISLAGIFLQNIPFIQAANARSMMAPDYKVDVNLKEIGGYSIFGGKIKVEIDNTVDMHCDNCR